MRQFAESQLLLVNEQLEQLLFEYRIRHLFALLILCVVVYYMQGFVLGYVIFYVQCLQNIDDVVVAHHKLVLVGAALIVLLEYLIFMQPLVPYFEYV